MKEFDVCIISKGAGDVLMNESDNYILGPDVKSALIASELADHGINVLLLSKINNKKSIILKPNLEIVSVNFWDNDTNILLKYFKIIKYISKIKTKNFFQHGSLPGIIGLYCILTNNNLILDIASDSQFMSIINKKLYSNGIVNALKYYLCNQIDVFSASKIIIQHKAQRHPLKLINKKIQLIEPFYHKCYEPLLTKPGADLIAWIGSISKIKQPKLFLDIAESMPNKRFIMIGGHHGENELYEEVFLRAQNIPNLILTGPIQHNSIESYYLKIKLLVNTSLYEGFPNTFIEAWYHHIPIVTMGVDPSNKITDFGLGMVFSDISEIISYIDDKYDGDYKIYEKNIDNYYITHHSHTNIDYYVNIFKESKFI